MQVLRLADVVEEAVCVGAVVSRWEKGECAHLWDRDAKGARRFREKVCHVELPLMRDWSGR